MDDDFGCVTAVCHGQHVNAVMDDDLDCVTAVCVTAVCVTAVCLSWTACECLKQYQKLGCRCRTPASCTWEEAVLPSYACAWGAAADGCGWLVHFWIMHGRLYS